MFITGLNFGVFRKDKKERRVHVTLIFTALFIVCTFLIFGTWLVNERSFVWEIDGSKQHYPALVYLGVWMRDIIRGIINGEGISIPLWDMNLGYGGDILTTLNYYSFGDPLDLFAVFVPYRYMEYFYSFLVLFRLYLAGLAFIFYCKKMNFGNNYGMIVGALIYCFSGYGLIFAIRHPFFINPMIYLPLILVGLERLLHRKKSFLFHIMIMVSVISNFYFFYMITIFIFFYALLRYLQIYGKIKLKELLPIFFKSVGAYLLAIANSALIFLPVLISFLGTERSESQLPANILAYDLEYYGNLPSMFITPGLNYSSTVIGTAGIAVVCFFIILLSRKKKEFTWLKILGAGMCIGLLFPVFGFAMNGFSYICNRWSFALVFLIALSFVLMETEIWNLGKKDWICLGGMSLVLLCSILFVPQARNEKNLVQAIMFLAGVFVLACGNYLYKKQSQNILRGALLGTIVIDITLKAYYNYSLYEGNLISGYYERGVAFNRLTDEAVTEMLETENNDNEYRVDALDRESRNYGVLDRLSTVSTYFSITSEGNTLFSRMLGNAAEECTVSIGNLDNRTGLNALFGVKYISSNSNVKNERIPYGYEKIKEETQTKYNGTKVTGEIYENKLDLGLIYTNQSIMPMSQFENLPVKDREQAMLNNLVVEDDSMLLDNYGTDTTYRKPEVLMSKEEILQQLDASENIDVNGDEIYVYADNTKVDLSFQGKENSETYLYLEGTSYEYKDSYDIYKDRGTKSSQLNENIAKRESRLEGEPTYTRITAENNGKSSLLEYKTEISTTKGIDTAILNVGYNETSINEMSVNFQHAGIYSFDNMEVLAQSMEEYEEDINAMQNITVEDFSIEDNSISATVTLEEDSPICIAVPYSKGWTAKINGEEVQVEKGNILFMVLEGTEGINSIEMSYCTPGLKVGAGITISATMITALYYLTDKNRSKNRRKREM